MYIYIWNTHDAHDIHMIYTWYTHDMHRPVSSIHSYHKAKSFAIKHPGERLTTLRELFTTCWERLTTQRKTCYVVKGRRLGRSPSLSNNLMNAGPERCWTWAMLEVSDAGCQRSSIRAPGPKRIRRGKPLTVPPSTPRFTVPPSTPRFNVEQGFALSETGSIKPFVLSTFGGYGMPPTLNLGVRGARLGHFERSSWREFHFQICWSFQNSDFLIVWFLFAVA